MNIISQGLALQSSGRPRSKVGPMVTHTVYIGNTPFQVYGALYGVEFIVHDIRCGSFYNLADFLRPEVVQQLEEACTQLELNSEPQKGGRDE